MAFRPPKAYKNIKFLSSHYARTIRILAEYLEPDARFRKEKIHDTIVFFGSARLCDRESAQKAIEGAQDSLSRRQAQRLLRTSSFYEDARELSRLLTQWSMGLSGDPARFVICSGGGPGIMEAANRGAHDAGGRSIGLNISLPFEQVPNPYITRRLSFEFHYFFMRKYWFAYLAKALVIFPGGFGTCDELMEILTLNQTGKFKKKMLVLIYGKRYWDEVLNFDAMEQWGMIDPQDREFIQYADRPQQAFDLITSWLSRYYPSNHE
jgi:hypothetical protein